MKKIIFLINIFCAQYIIPSETSKKNGPIEISTEELDNFYFYTMLLPGETSEEHGAEDFNKDKRGIKILMPIIYKIRNIRSESSENRTLYTELYEAVNAKLKNLFSGAGLGDIFDGDIINIINDLDLEEYGYRKEPIKYRTKIQNKEKEKIRKLVRFYHVLDPDSYQNLYNAFEKPVAVAEKLTISEKKCLTQEVIKQSNLCNFGSDLVYDKFQGSNHSYKTENVGGKKEIPCIKMVRPKRYFVQLATVNQFTLAYKLKKEPAFCGGATYRNGFLMSQYHDTQNTQFLLDIRDEKKAETFLKKLGFQQWNSASNVRKYINEAARKGEKIDHVAVLDNIVMLDKKFAQTYPKYFSILIEESEYKHAQDALEKVQKGIKQDHF
ncbi:MAG TPA: hypothetical protein VEK38_03950, partial [Candidatus Bathyarchaeia archaeon]|nr:hypothetical protein [Candidatus Bathyarchaeia archaeon]